jgi:mono/diheme cytochrome c family protein
MVSTVNRIPSDADLVRTIRFGQPGTSMPAFAKLTDENVESLIPVLRQFMNEGLRERYKNESSDVADSNEITPTESETQWMLDHSQPGTQVDVPDLKSGESITARGRVLFQTSGCSQCHATDRLAPVINKQLFDGVGRPIYAPNLSIDSFHSGTEARDIYLRIALGIPGTPHPALAENSADETGAITAFIQSIHSPNPTPSTNYQRGVR